MGIEETIMKSRLCDTNGGKRGANKRIQAQKRDSSRPSECDSEGRCRSIGAVLGDLGCGGAGDTRGTKSSQNQPNTDIPS
jgi:hypothetical protein